MYFIIDQFNGNALKTAGKYFRRLHVIFPILHHVILPMSTSFAGLTTDYEILDAFVQQTVSTMSVDKARSAFASTGRCNISVGGRIPRVELILTNHGYGCK
ncbi:hypothetical protein TNIN_14831 [Trichonephila inaurata madagascariensis]|uniref:Uncharacterized protein n=1 Tax=Trichonephila inaurata madagascariensis TaxID=2747483 RepID=A0A8X6XHY5_9ARAC|nr:hypothetical protein TNIN_14831 [Trichonephila inaurata madagascariensis]